ncbi:MAG: hypothetical protein OIF57_14835 [Marinobacterium sp.]|nr:hypothetical protein [Marinobacterium sp.]
MDAFYCIPELALRNTFSFNFMRLAKRLFAVSYCRQSAEKQRRFLPSHCVFKSFPVLLLFRFY